MRKIGIFGGTFDPIHFGHLRPALEILDAVPLDEIRFVPAGEPPHRGTPIAPAALRLAMVRAAVAGEPRFGVDEREINAAQPAYTVDTLAALRREFPADALVLIVGMDAFLGLPGWHLWQRIFELAHLVVAHRPGWALKTEGVLGEVVRQRGTRSADEIARRPSGSILMQEVTQLEISSTRVRDAIAIGGDPRYLVPDAVRDLIQSSHCYLKHTEY